LIFWVAKMHEIV